MTRENAFRKHRESGAETHSQPICLKPPAGRLMLLRSRSWLCRYFVHDVLFKQKITYLRKVITIHHPLARDRGDARLNWTKSTCGFCSSITTATAQRANKLKNSGHFVSIKLFSEYNPAALQPASGQACRLKTLFKWCLVIVNRQL